MAKLIFCHSDYRGKDGYIAPHSHECKELVFYGDTAQGETEIGGEKYIFAPASVALIHQGILHSENHLAGTNVMFFGFEAHASLPDGVWNNMNEVKSLFCDIVEEVRNQEWGYEKIISLKIQEILAFLERKNTGESNCVKNLAYCKRYIEENYMQDISVGELAKMTCYSSDRFRHLFAEEFGLYPQNYLMKVRLENASHLLRTTDYSCMEIAMMCGFADSGQMTKMIKKKYGMTPNEIRKSAIKC
ncbi:MAG: helix-turn-helix transcriptional regulator [Roseburia sp.]|nr:helix-turn-helix transcriptional regulator [Roseburia sp.]